MSIDVFLKINFIGAFRTDAPFFNKVLEISIKLWYNRNIYLFLTIERYVLL